MPAHRVTHVLAVMAALAWAALIGPIDIPAAHADPCPNVEVVFARGTNTPAGTVGPIGQSFIDSLKSQIGGRSLGVYQVNYPATLSAMADSANAGANDVSAHVQDMIGRCPSTRLVLSGLSQGAGVMDFATNNLPPTDHVAAVALFGNPQSALAGTLTGVAFPPVGPAYIGKTIDQCAPDDPACSGGLNPSAHGSYAANGMTAEAATYVASRL